MVGNGVVCARDFSFLGKELIDYGSLCGIIGSIMTNTNKMCLTIIAIALNAEVYVIVMSEV